MTLLTSLQIKGRAPMTGYSRDRFGPAWTDNNNDPLGHNGCDTRNDILRRDLTQVAVKPGSNGCTVLSGTLTDPYTATTIAFERGPDTSSRVEVDHVVALADAWQTGAQQWGDARRVDLANDPLNLLAVTASANQHKGDADAATWLPPNTAYRCAYVARQVAVKARYDLWVTSAEHDAIARVLSRCATQPAPAESGTPARAQPTRATTAHPAPPPTRHTTNPPPPPPRPTTTSAPPATTLICVASMSNPNPAQYSTTDVIVRTGLAGASVTATAHYKTTDTSHAGLAASTGVADIPFRISRATIGYTVAVDVTVTGQGTTKSCSTSFTPH